ncbi:MAG: hypothetical protein QW057_02295 [Candidatus Bathyarchaeia archaeon]
MSLEACWRHLTDVFPPQPRVRVRVVNTRGHPSITLNLMVDTGFSGYISLHKEAIGRLGLEPLGSASVLTASGRVKTLLYVAKAEVLDADGNLQFTLSRHDQDSLVQTDAGAESLDVFPQDAVLIQDLGLPLIGLRALAARNWLLFNTGNAFCLLR